MFETHQGNVRLVSEFDNVWESLNKTGERSLQTVRKRTPFIAKAIVIGKGKHLDERAIVFFGEKNGKRKRNATSYECCWGHYYNCDGTRIGMYCEPLGRSI